MKRLNALEDFEASVDLIDVRSYLSWYIDKQISLTMPNGRSSQHQHNLHDGGIALSLSLLDSNASDDGDSSSLSSSSDDDNESSSPTGNNGLDSPSSTSSAVKSIILEHKKKEEASSSSPIPPLSPAPKIPSRKSITKWTNVVFISKDEKSEVEKRHNLELHGKGRGLLGFGKHGAPKEEIQISMREATGALVSALSPKSPDFSPCRASFCYALNNQRSANTEVTPPTFDALGEVMEAFLSGCCWETCAEDIANAKMLMILGQTFFVLGKDKMVSNDDFWDQALFMCIREALQHSKVMSSLQDQAMVSKRGSNRVLPTTSEKKWHDLMVEQRAQAAGQVLGIVTAQLTALAHSIVEYSDGKREKGERAKKFVRRMSVRYQLPVSRRQMLLEHIGGGGGGGGERRRAKSEKNFEI